MSMAHTHEDLAAFQDGDVPLIFARHKETDELELLEDGTAETKRDHTKEMLVCPIMDCPSRDLTTVARKGRRDGYRPPLRWLPRSGGHLSLSGLRDDHGLAQGQICGSCVPRAEGRTLQRSGRAARGRDGHACRDWRTHRVRDPVREPEPR